MAVVYEVTALYRHHLQPKDFENITAEVGLKAQLEDGDNVNEAAATLLDECRMLTRQAITGKAIGKGEGEVTVAKTTKSKKTKASTRGISDTPEDRGEQEDVDLGEDEAEEEKPKPKRETAAAKKKRLAAEAKAAEEAASEDESEFPEDDDEDADDDFDPSELDDDDGEDVISKNDLQVFITGSVTDKLITVTAAKEIISEFGDGAGRTKDIDDAHRNRVYEELQKAIAANKKKAKAKK